MRARFVGLAVGVLGVSGGAGAQDTVRVQADGPPVWGSPVRLTRELVIGQLDGPPEYAFGSVERVAVDAQGAIYIYDRDDTQIRKYDARGRFLTLVGRNGSGPGEYREPSGLAVLQDSLLLVCDPSNGRMTFFGPDGRLRSTVAWPRSPWSSSGECTVDSAGLIYRRVVAAALPAGVEAGINASTQYVRLRASGEAVDSLHLGARDFASRPFVVTGAAGTWYNFPDENVFASYSGGGVLSGRTTQYRIYIRDPRGRVRMIERAHRPVPLGGAERDEWLAYVENMRRRGSPIEHVIPREKPAFRALLSDDQGRIWVQLYVAAEKRPPTPRPANVTGPRLTWREREVYDVFAPEGTYLGRVELPYEARLLAIRGDRLYVREIGADWEHRVVVYRLVT